MNPVNTMAMNQTAMNTKIHRSIEFARGVPDSTSGRGCDAGICSAIVAMTSPLSLRMKVMGRGTPFRIYAPKNCMREILRFFLWSVKSLEDCVRFPPPLLTLGTRSAQDHGMHSLGFRIGAGLASILVRLSPHPPSLRAGRQRVPRPHRHRAELAQSGRTRKVPSLRRRDSTC